MYKSWAAHMGVLSCWRKMVLYEHTVILFEHVYVYTTKRVNSECQCPKVFISIKTFDRDMERQCQCLIEAMTFTYWETKEKKCIVRMQSWPSYMYKAFSLDRKMPCLSC